MQKPEVKERERRKEAFPLTHWVACLHQLLLKAFHRSTFSFLTSTSLNTQACLEAPEPFLNLLELNQPIFQGSVQIPLSSMKTSQNLLTHLLSQKWAHPLLTFHHTFSSFPFLWPCSPLSRSSPTYWPMNCRQGLHLSVISLWIPRIESGIACYLHQWPHGWRWEDGRNGGIMLCLDSCQGSPFLPLHTSYELSPWITKMLGSAISFFLIIQYPDQPHLLLPKLVDEDSGMPWSRRWFV